ncbi:hypothetical protein BC830DRAFT_1112768 [Chytriomyces sp. MP71]|nr:hypothetical protein BC830DRAFT_1112768 [Chytriomyces sp. MP71]
MKGNELNTLYPPEATATATATGSSGQGTTATQQSDQDPAPEYEDLPREPPPQSLATSDVPQSNSSFSGSQEPVIPPPEPGEVDVDIPRYDDLLPTSQGSRDLVSLILDPTNTPNYFPVLRPSLLEDKIPNIVYTARITALNSSLLSSGSLFTSQVLVVFVNVLVASSIITLLWLTFQSSFHVSVQALNAAWFLPLIIMLLIATKPQYIRIVEEAVDKWTKDDKEAGINVQYRLVVTRTHKWRLLFSAKIIIYEQLLAPGVVSNTEALPTYSAETLP